MEEINWTEWRDLNRVTEYNHTAMVQNRRTEHLLLVVTTTDKWKICVRKKPVTD
jgi:hypothetical protein